ncbi:hypothetical protein, partial [Salmonella sp. s51944]|uniref:hypothetical protein n=1 Tax=Salmonella sp. s51944 TaxID=3159655 RepID=UPI00397EDF36
MLFDIVLIISFAIIGSEGKVPTRDSKGHFCGPIPQPPMKDRPNGIYQCARNECPVYTTIREHVSDLEDFPENVTIRKV